MKFGHLNGVANDQQTLKTFQYFKDGNLENNVFT
jgi:hypothetical protein